jgi:DNA invertase Pin-like site-specific DNA recombinase
VVIKCEAVSAKMTEDQRKILQEGDLLLVSNLDRLGRSIHQIVAFFNWLVENQINFTVVSNDSIRLRVGEDDFVSKILCTIFSVLAEVEHKVLQDRIRAGVALALARGVKFGRKAGSRYPSKLDGKEEVIRGALDAGVTKTRIARISTTGLQNWLNYTQNRPNQ